MTKALSEAEKKQRKEDRRKSQQQKPPSTTVETVTQPKPEEPPAQPVSLCDDCAYEVMECEGSPKFASDQDETLTGSEADRVIECPAFVNVAEMPTAQETRQGAAPGPAAPEGEARVCDREGGPTEDQVIRTDLPQRPDPKRFNKEEDLGTCQSCERSLKRTALNRYQDAVRCTNPRCRAYRAIVRHLSTGVK